MTAAPGPRWQPILSLSTSPRTSCYTSFVSKNVTITAEEEVLKWARHQAAEKGTSVSKFVGELMKDEMRRTDAYWKACTQWKKLKPIEGLDASKRLTREELHERR